MFGICQFVRFCLLFWGFSCFVDLFEICFASGKVTYVKPSLCSACKSDHSKAQKSLFLVVEQWLISFFTSIIVKSIYCACISLNFFDDHNDLLCMHAISY